MDLDDQELKATRERSVIMDIDKAIDIFNTVFISNNFESFSSETIVIEAMKTVLNAYNKLVENETNSFNNLYHIENNKGMTKVVKN